MASKRAPFNITMNVYKKVNFVIPGTPYEANVACRFVPALQVVPATATPVQPVGYVTSLSYYPDGKFIPVGGFWRWTTADNFVVELSTSPGVYKEVLYHDYITDFFTFTYYRYWIYNTVYDA